MEAKIVPYKPFGCTDPNYKVYAKKVLLRICKMTFWRWSLVADCYHYEYAKCVANTISMIEVK